MGSTWTRKKTRVGYDHVLDDEKVATCLLQGAVAHFAAHGITRIAALMTDNH